MKRQEKSRFTANVLFILLIILPYTLAIISVAMSIGLFSFYQYKDDNVQTNPNIEVKNVKKVVKKGQELQITYKDNSEKTYKVADNFRLSESGIDMSKVAIHIENDSAGASKARDILLAFIPVIVIAFPLIFCLMMLYHALAIYKKYGVMWTVLILLLFPIGAIAYHFMVYRHPEAARK